MKTNLKDNFKMIEFNCKNQFGLHSIWVWAKASMTAYNNGKYNLAMNALKKLQRLVRPLSCRANGIADATKCIDMFVSQMVEKILEKDPDAKYPSNG